MSKHFYQVIQFSISTQFHSIWPIDRTLSGATTPGQSRPGSDGNEGVLHIPESSSITGTSASDCLVSYPGHSLGRGQSYPLRREAVSVLYSPSWMGRVCVQKLFGYIVNGYIEQYISDIKSFKINFSVNPPPQIVRDIESFTFNL